jgi:hypothetical protein
VFDGCSNNWFWSRNWRNRSRSNWWNVNFANITCPDFGTRTIESRVVVEIGTRSIILTRIFAAGYLIFTVNSGVVFRTITRISQIVIRIDTVPKVLTREC